MEGHAVRGIYTFFAAGFAAVLFARGLAYWLEWQPWSVRWAGLACVALATVGVFTEISVGTGLKALLAAAVVCAIYIWQDVGLERRDAEEEAREREEMMRKL